MPNVLIFLTFILSFSITTGLASGDEAYGPEVEKDLKITPITLNTYGFFKIHDRGDKKYQREMKITSCGGHPYFLKCLKSRVYSRDIMLQKLVKRRGMYIKETGMV